MIVLFLILTLFISVFTQQCQLNPSSHRFTFGNFTGVVLSDGPIRLPSNFFNVPDQEVTRSYAQLYRPTNPLIWQQNIPIIDTPHGRIIVDTGSFGLSAPPFTDAGKLLPNLAAAGISAESIDIVLLTHGHPDHVSGLLNADGGRAFPNAQVYVSEEEFQFWTADPFVNPIENPALPNFATVFKNALSPYEGHVTVVKNDTSPLPGVKYVLSPGHTPGHSAVIISSGNEKLVCLGDAVFSQPDQVRNPGWSRPVETDPLQAFNSRVTLMEMLADNGALALTFHEDFPGLGRFVKTAQSFDWVPARIQSMGVVETVC